MTTPFEAAKQAYPAAVRIGKSWWQLVDGELVSGMEAHRGKLILQEDRDGCSQEFNHWGSYVMASEFEASTANAEWDALCDQYGIDTDPEMRRKFARALIELSDSGTGHFIIGPEWRPIIGQAAAE